MPITTETHEEISTDETLQARPAKRSRRSSILDVPNLSIATVFHETDDSPVEGSDRTINLGHRKFVAKKTESFPQEFTESGSEKKCFLALSMGSKHTEGARLDAMLKWVSENYDECAIMPGDYIYRFTLELLDESLTPEEAQVKAVEASKSYKQSIAPIVAQYAHLCKFEWMPLSKLSQKYKEDFAVLYEEMKSLYTTDRDFRASVRTFTGAYLERVSMAADKRAKTLALTYLLEECAIFAALGKHEFPSTFVYSGKVGVIIDLIEGKFKGSPSSLTQERVRFLSVLPDSRGKFSKNGDGKVIKASVSELEAAFDPLSPREMTFLDQFEESDKKKLLKFTKIKRFRPGQSLIEFGDTKKPLILLEKGRAEEFMVDADNGTSLIRTKILGDGAVVGVVQFLDETSRSPVIIKALDTCEARSLSKKDFNRMVEKEADLADHVRRVLAGILKARKVGSAVFSFSPSKLDA